QRSGILSVFVEVCVEDSLIHKVGLTFNVEEHPAQVVQLQHGESVGKAGNCFFDLLPILADGVLSAGLDPRDDREAITRGGLGKDRAISSLLEFEVSLLGDRHGGGFCPIVLLLCVCHIASFFVLFVLFLIFYFHFMALC